MLHRPTRFPALRVGLPVLTFLSAMLPEARAEPGFVLVEAGVRRAPIVVAAEAPPATRRAADELAVYVEKISGARPQVLAGCPDTLPEHALWVGHQPAVDALFLEIDFAF